MQPPACRKFFAGILVKVKKTEYDLTDDVFADGWPKLFDNDR